jgi:hypothetical protein
MTIAVLREDQQNENSPLNRNGNQFHQDQQNEQSPVNSNGNQFHQDQQANNLKLGGIDDHCCFEVIAYFVDLGGID